MAFQQAQQRSQAVRQSSFPKTASDLPAPLSPTRKRTIEESQEWILFSPAHNADTQSRTSQTPRTATHLSDFGSLETHVRSQPLGSSEDAGDATCLGTDVDDEGAELDSLDDGLHAFQHHPFSSTSLPLDQSGGTLLPTHDGLGTFTSSGGLQEQLWQFERHNPHRRRHVRRRSSLQRRIDEVEEEQELDPEDERIARIEKWRLEQSKAVLEEIERETRRRRKMTRMSGVSDSTNPQAIAGLSTLLRQDSVIPGEPEPTKGEEQEQGESWWQRITRRVIQDLIGLDENTLSVIFGEELVDNASPTPTQPSPIATAVASESQVAFHDPGHNWEAKLLERIARELGVLVHQFSDHERAFLSKLDETDYSGMNLAQRETTTRQPRRMLQRRRPSSHGSASFALSDDLFRPTIQQAPLSPTEQTDTSLWGIEEEPTQAKAEAEGQYQSNDWERDVDVNMIFSYLKRRFSSTINDNNNTTTSPKPTNTGPLPASWATGTKSASALGSSPESLRRAENLRRQHPLVSRAAERAAAQSKRRESLLKRHQMSSMLQRRTAGGSSSCASHSTKRSRRSLSGSSRHYWDIGGSVGSVGSRDGFGSSALGGWGEV